MWAEGGKKLRGEPSAASRTQIRRRVRTIAMVVLVASWGLALSVAVGPAAAAGCSPPHHGPILIQRDSHFTRANGVVSGSGTAAAPYNFANLPLKDLRPRY